MEIELVVFIVVEHLFNCHILFKGEIGFAILSIRVGFFEEEENRLHVFEVLCWTWRIFLKHFSVLCELICRVGIHLGKHAKDCVSLIHHSGSQHVFPAFRIQESVLPV